MRLRVRRRKVNGRLDTNNRPAKWHNGAVGIQGLGLAIVCSRRHGWRRGPVCSWKGNGWFSHHPPLVRSSPAVPQQPAVGVDYRQPEHPAIRRKVPLVAEAAPAALAAMGLINVGVGAHPEEVERRHFPFVLKLAGEVAGQGGRNVRRLEKATKLTWYRRW